MFSPALVGVWWVEISFLSGGVVVGTLVTLGLAWLWLANFWVWALLTKKFGADRIIINRKPSTLWG